MKLSNMVTAKIDAIGRADTLPGIQYTEPVGDPGLFGPSSAVWHAHGHYSAPLGGVAALLMQALEPGMGQAGINNSKVFEEPFERFGRSASFVIGMTFAARPVTDRLVRVVRTMHARVSGELPDGRPYSARDPHSLWVAALMFPIGVGKAISATTHDRYRAKTSTVSYKNGRASPKRSAPPTYRAHGRPCDTPPPKLRPHSRSTRAPAPPGKCLSANGRPRPAASSPGGQSSTSSNPGLAASTTCQTSRRLRPRSPEAQHLPRSTARS